MFNLKSLTLRPRLAPALCNLPWERCPGPWLCSEGLRLRSASPSLQAGLSSAFAWLVTFSSVPASQEGNSVGSAPSWVLQVDTQLLFKAQMWPRCPPPHLCGCLAHGNQPRQEEGLGDLLQ